MKNAWNSLEPVGKWLFVGIAGVLFLISPLLLAMFTIVAIVGFAFVTDN